MKISENIKRSVFFANTGLFYFWGGWVPSQVPGALSKGFYTPEAQGGRGQGVGRGADEGWEPSARKHQGPELAIGIGLFVFI